jgi:hypothetical protein
VEIVGIAPDVKNTGLSVSDYPEYYILRSHVLAGDHERVSISQVSVLPSNSMHWMQPSHLGLF